MKNDIRDVKIIENTTDWQERGIIVQKCVEYSQYIIIKE